MDEKEAPKCPRCGSDSPISEIAGAGKRCGACGFQWNVSKNPVSDAVLRRRAFGVQGNWRRPEK